MADEAGTTSAVKDPFAVSGSHCHKVFRCTMPEESERDAIKVCTAACDRFQQMKDIAQFIKLVRHGVGCGF